MEWHALHTALLGTDTSAYIPTLQFATHAAPSRAKPTVHLVHTDKLVHSEQFALQTPLHAVFPVLEHTELEKEPAEHVRQATHGTEPVMSL